MRAKAGDWTRVAAAGEIPAEIDGKPVKSLRLIIVVDGFAPDEEIHFDDLTIFRLECSDPCPPPTTAPAATRSSPTTSSAGCARGACCRTTGGRRRDPLNSRPLPPLLRPG